MRNLGQSNKFLKEKGNLLVTLGFGPVQAEGLINIDYSNRAKLAKYVPLLYRIITRLYLIPPTEFSENVTIVDVRKALHFNNISVLAFNVGEFPEHLLPKEAEMLMRECFRALVPGGHLMINVPDNYRFWKRY